jgi:hypothetical protein
VIYALVLAVLSLPVSVGVSLLVCTRYLASRDARDASERAVLLQRIQDPGAAVAQHVVQHQGDPSPYLPFEDDAAFIAYQQELNG